MIGIRGIHLVGPREVNFKTIIGRGFGSGIILNVFSNCPCEYCAQPFPKNLSLLCFLAFDMFPMSQEID